MPPPIVYLSFPGLNARAPTLGFFHRSYGTSFDKLQVWGDRAPHNMNVAMLLVDVFHRVWEICRHHLAT